MMYFNLPGLTKTNVILYTVGIPAELVKSFNQKAKGCKQQKYSISKSLANRLDFIVC